MAISLKLYTHGDSHRARSNLHFVGSHAICACLFWPRLILMTLCWLRSQWKSHLTIINYDNYPLHHLKPISTNSPTRAHTLSLPTRLFTARWCYTPISPKSARSTISDRTRESLRGFWRRAQLSEITWSFNRTYLSTQRSYGGTNHMKKYLFYVKFVKMMIT